jgi:hypothetical protein
MVTIVPKNTAPRRIQVFDASIAIATLGTTKIGAKKTKIERKKTRKKEQQVTTEAILLIILTRKLD